MAWRERERLIDNDGLPTSTRLQNHPQFYDYDEEGLPPEQYFGEMNKKKRAEYEEYKRSIPPGYRFVMKEELISYCRCDFE